MAVGHELLIEISTRSLCNFLSGKGENERGENRIIKQLYHCIGVDN